MASTALLRPMTHADLDAVAANERQAYAFPWSRGVFVDCLDAGYACWVACVADRIVGHGVLSVGAGEAQLLNVCIEPAAQGAGHGRALATRLVSQARLDGADAVFLEVRLSNRVAMTLYDGMGFREIGRRRNYYPAQTGREEAVIMALRLPGHGDGDGKRRSVGAAGVL